MNKKTYLIDKDRVLKSVERTKEFKVGVEYPFDTFVSVYPEYFMEKKEIDEILDLLLSGGNAEYNEDSVDMDTNILYIQKEIK